MQWRPVLRAGHNVAMRHTGTAVRRHMSVTETALHAVMILCTLGLWYPVYKHRKNKLARTTRIYQPGSIP